jgi:(S)-sulfolactate dehydrogenase
LSDILITEFMDEAAALGRMKPAALLINAARGGIVDEAALDVFETEPLDAGAGAILRGIPNLILTPHIAGVTEESNVRVSSVTAHAVLEVLAAL